MSTHNPFTFSLPTNLWRDEVSQAMVSRGSTQFYLDFKKQEGPQLTLVSYKQISNQVQNKY